MDGSKPSLMTLLGNTNIYQHLGSKWGLNFQNTHFFLAFSVCPAGQYEYDPSPPSQVISLVKPQRWSPSPTPKPRWSPSPVRPQKNIPLKKHAAGFFSYSGLGDVFLSGDCGRMNWMCQCFNWIIAIFWMCWWGLEWAPKKALAHPVHRIDLAEWNHISPT